LHQNEDLAEKVANDFELESNVGILNVCSQTLSIKPLKIEAEDEIRKSIKETIRKRFSETSVAMILKVLNFTHWQSRLKSL
jgi:hypothetical protein